MVEVSLASHALALEQLENLERASRGRFQVDRARTRVNGSTLLVAVTVACRGFERRTGGLPLRDRERFTVFVADKFPFEHPFVHASHTRFAGFGHVQWMRHLCLYQSPSTEWSPRDGMFGLMQRLVDWLEKGARAEFEPGGAPLHPPVAYARGKGIVVSRADTPTLDGDEPWTGVAYLQPVHDERVDLVGWGEESIEVPSGLVPAVAILLRQDVPFEFPGTVKEVFDLVETRGVTSCLRPLLRIAERPSYETPIYVVVGTPMRGVSGDVNRKQHLVVWRIGAAFADKLRLLMSNVIDRDEYRELKGSLLQEFVTWSTSATVEWVTVNETRPEVTSRRDDGAPMQFFAGKAVAVWGCGALGANVALMLARAGVRRLVLRDEARVTPGILVRQPFEDADIGRAKADCLKERIERIDASIVVEAHCEDLIDSPFSASDWTEGVDVVVDASASLAVLERIELARKTGRRVPMVNMVIDGRAERALVTIAKAEHSGGPSDVSRKAKVVACGRGDLREFADAFWPRVRPPVFQPEPGCSASTYRGSAADVMTLAASSLNIAADSLARSSTRESASAYFVLQPHVFVKQGMASIAALEWGCDRVHDDPDSGYQIRISPAAWAEMEGWVAKSVRPRDKGFETGGVLFGERNDASRVVWVDEVLGPPADSRSSASRFDCGVRGVVAAIAEKRARTRDSVDYLGMWHTHPGSPPMPSATDEVGMETLTRASGSANSKALLVILRTDGGRTTGYGAYLFSRVHRRVAV